MAAPAIPAQEDHYHKVRTPTLICISGAAATGKGAPSKADNLGKAQLTRVRMALSPMKTLPARLLTGIQT